MKWTEPKNPTKEVSHYNHVIAETPIGRMIIEWSGWKQDNGYSIMLNDDWIGVGFDLEDAKKIGKNYLNNKLQELTEYLLK